MTEQVSSPGRRSVRRTTLGGGLLLLLLVADLLPALAGWKFLRERVVVVGALVLPLELLPAVLFLVAMMLMAWGPLAAIARRPPAEPAPAPFAFSSCAVATIKAAVVVALILAGLMDAVLGLALASDFRLSGPDAAGCRVLTVTVASLHHVRSHPVAVPSGTWWVDVTDRGLDVQVCPQG